MEVDFPSGKHVEGSQARQCPSEEVWPGLLDLVSKTTFSSLTDSLTPCPNSSTIVCGHVTEPQPIERELKQCIPRLSLVSKFHLLMFFHVFSTFWRAGMKMALVTLEAMY